VVDEFSLSLDRPRAQPIPGFGTKGESDLRENLGRGPATSQSVVLSSPGIVYKELVIVGGRNPETLPAPPGDIRAYDVRTGNLRWSVSPIPATGEFGLTPGPACVEDHGCEQLGGMSLDSGSEFLFTHWLGGIDFMAPIESVTIFPIA